MPTNQFTIDTSQGNAALKSIIDEFKKYNATIKSVVDAQLSMDASGKVLGATLQATTKGGSAVTAVLRDLGKGLQVVESQASRTGAALDSVSKAARARLQAARDASAKTIPSQIAKAFGPLDPKATEADQLRIKNATRALIEMFKSGGISAKAFQNIVSGVASGTSAVMTGTAGNFQKQLDIIASAFGKAEGAGRRFREKTLKDQDKAATQRLGQLLATQAGPKIRGLFDFSTLDGKQLETVQAKIVGIQNAIKGGKITLKEFSEGIKQFATGDIGNLTGGAERVRKALSGIGNIINPPGAKPPSFDLASFGNSLSFTLGIVQAQLLYNSISRLVDLFKQAAEEAAEFQRGIALIQTISEDANLSFGQWAQGIKAVSDEFGKPIAEVASAGYDLLSNQVSKAADTFDTLRIAASFARITNSDVKDSVDLLSSAINSFQLKAGDAERVSSIFFTTIDLGRIKAEELANTFGRTGVFAHSLGVSLTETAAALTTITRQGVQADTAQTLLNNVFQKMLNPTEKLQELYDKLGVGTGEAFIKTYGFVGALEKLKEVTGGSTAKLADFFNEIRGSQGINTLISRLDEFRADLVKIENPGNTINLAKLVTGGNFGQVFQDELNKFRNYFLTGFQTVVLEGVLKVTNAFGGLSKVAAGTFSSIASGVVATIGGVVAPLLVGLVSKMSLAGVSTITLATKFDQLAGSALAFGKAHAVFAIGAGVALLVKQAIDAKIAFNGMKQSASEAADALGAAIRTGHTAALTDTRNNFIKVLEEQQKGLLDNTAKLRIKLDEAAEAQKNLAETIADSVRNSFDVLLGSIRRVVGDIEKEETRAINSMKSLAEKLTDLQKERSSQIFERRLATNDRNVENAKSAASFVGADPHEAGAEVDRTKKIFADRIDQLRGVAKKALVDYKNSIGEEADAAIRRSLEAYDEINRLQDRLGNLEDKSQIGRGRHKLTNKDRAYRNEGPITDSYREEVQVIRKLREDENKRRDSARAAAAEKKRDLESFQTLAGKISKFDPFDKKGNLKKEFKTPEDAAKKLKSLQDQATKLAEKFTSPLERIGLGTTFRKQLADLKKDLAEQLGNTKDVTRITAIQERVDALRDSILEKNPEAIKSFDDMRKSVEETNKSIEELLKNTQQVVLSLAGNLQGAQIEKDGLSLNSIYKTLGLLGDASSTKALNSLGKSLSTQNFKQAAVDLDVYRESLKGLTVNGKSALEANVLPETETTPAQNTGQLINQLKIQLEELVRRQETQKAQMAALAQASTTISQSAPGIKAAADAVKALGDSFKVPETKSKEAADNIIRNLDTVLKKAEDVIKELGNINNKTPVSKPTDKVSYRAPSEDTDTAQYVEMGGHVRYMAAGGPVGRDTQMAYLDPEEFVMDRYNTRKFYSQLVQMNRGQSPRMGGDGASHMTVGDIHINGTGQNPHEIADTVIRTIERRQRIGTMRKR